MANGSFVFTLWDVGHGMSIWINTPNGSNHWIDLGKTPQFSPSRYVALEYGVRNIDYLIISHPDKDHLEDLPNFISSFGDPRVISRNGTLPAEEMFGQRAFQYQVDFEDMHARFNIPDPFSESPTNPANNGGVSYAVCSLDHGTSIGGATPLSRSIVEGNNTSLVVMLRYRDVLFVCPGDIEPLGWQALWRNYSNSYNELIGGANWRFLVAPHHGRRSGYCREIMESIVPHATLISDVWGASETHPAFRTDPIGVRFRNGEVVKFYSTKRGGRVRFCVSPTDLTIDQFDN